MLVKIPEPVPQNFKLVSKSVCKDLSAWDLVADFFIQPKSCDENIHLDLFHQETSIQLSFTLSNITETHSTAAHKNCRVLTLFGKQMQK